MIYFFSMDALFEGSLPTLGAVDLFRRLVDREETFLILTDKANRTRRQMAQHLYDSGFPLLYEELFYTSTMAAVDAVRRNYPEKRTAFYLGNEALGNTLREGGFIIDLNKADWLFVGSNKNATYRDYCDALRIIDGGAVVISACDDVREAARDMTGIGPGAVTAMLEAASGKKALHAGWPSSLLLKKAIRYMGCAGEDVIFISSDLENQINVAINAGIKTMFVLNNRQLSEDLRDSPIRPTYIVENLKGVLV